MDNGDPEDAADTEKEDTEITGVVDANRGKSPFDGLETKSGDTDTRCEIGIPTTEGNENEKRVFLP